MRREYIYAAVSIFCWSTVATVTKLLMGTINNFQLLWCSTFFAGIFLLAVNAITGRLKLLKGYSWRQIGTMALIGLPGTFFYYVFYYAGSARMPASTAFIINYLWPIMSVVFACIVMKRRFTVRKMIAILMSFLGVVIVTLGGLNSFTGEMLTGAVLCALGAASYGLFTALNTKYRFDKQISMMINYGVSFTLTTVINASNGALFIPTGIQALGIAWNGIFTMAIAGTFWMLALERGKTEKISNLAYITPFVSLIWIALFLNEGFQWTNFLGALVIVAGILVQFREPQKVKR